MSHLPLESVVLMIVVPKESINISATPSLSFILKHIVMSHSLSISRHRNIVIGTNKQNCLTQHSAVDWKSCPWSSWTPPGLTTPPRTHRILWKQRGLCCSFIQNILTCLSKSVLLCLSTVVAGPVQWCVALVVSEVYVSMWGGSGSLQ